MPVCKMDGPVPLRECTLTAFGAELFSGGLLKIEQGVAVTTTAAAHRSYGFSPTSAEARVLTPFSHCLL